MTEVRGSPGISSMRLLADALAETAVVYILASGLRGLPAGLALVDAGVFVRNAIGLMIFCAYNLYLTSLRRIDYESKLQSHIRLSVG